MLPERFKWLETIGTLPKLVTAGLQYIGVKEIPGAASNPVIIDMARGLGISDIYKNDDTAWCALFINHLLRITGKPPLDTHGDKYNYLRAKYMMNWGGSVKPGDERLGDIMIFDRPGGGHTALMIAQTGSTYIVLGGNQSNSVSFTEIPKNRLIGCRRYYSIAMPESAKAYNLESWGEISTNEA